MGTLAGGGNIQFRVPVQLSNFMLPEEKRQQLTLSHQDDMALFLVEVIMGVVSACVDGAFYACAVHEPSSAASRNNCS